LTAALKKAKTKKRKKENNSSYVLDDNCALGCPQVFTDWEIAFKSFN